MINQFCSDSIQANDCQSTGGEGWRKQQPEALPVLIWVYFQHATRLNVFRHEPHLPMVLTLRRVRKVDSVALRIPETVDQCRDFLSPSLRKTTALPESLVIKQSIPPPGYNVESDISEDASFPLLDLVCLIKEWLDGLLRIMPLSFWTGITEWQPTDGIQLADNLVWPTQCLKDRNISHKYPFSSDFLKNKWSGGPQGLFFLPSKTG